MLKKTKTQTYQELHISALLFHLRLSSSGLVLLVSKSEHESSCESWLLKCLCFLLTCLLTLHCILVLCWCIWKLFLTAAAPLLPLRLHPRGSGLYCARYEQIFILSKAFTLNRQWVGDREEVHCPLRNKWYSDLLKAVHVIAVRASNWKLGELPSARKKKLDLSKICPALITENKNCFKNKLKDSYDWYVSKHAPIKPLLSQTQILCRHTQRSQSLSGWSLVYSSETVPVYIWLN